MYHEAQAFLATLTSDQSREAQYPFESEERFDWHYVPRERKGLSLQQMTPPQREAANVLLGTGLSRKGWTQTETIRRLETVLKAIEQGTGPLRDPERYYLTLFGEPRKKGLWGWRYEGHHISLHWVLRDGQVIASTPQFLGANPAEVRHGPMQGTRVLAPEEDLGRSLVRALKTEQKRIAVLSDVAPPDIVTGVERKAALLEHRGLAYPQLERAQQRTLQALLEEYVATQAAVVAAARRHAIREAGLDAVKFAWMGGLEPGQGHYYRIQSPTFVIEYDNTQNDANHIHTVWRDFHNDFGLDLLEDHYHQSSHHQE